MHAATITGLLIALAVSGGCGDDAKKATVSDDTSWQIACVPGGGAGCSGSLGAHRADRDDVKLKVSCRRDESGLFVELEDPGQEAQSVEVRARPYGKLTLQRLDPEKNRCTVILEEEELGTDGELDLTGHCGDDSDSACTVNGELDRDGWAFSGEITCSGLQYEGLTDDGTGPFTLQKAGSGSREPMVLKIANCD
jgi:hypothetical protein